MNTKELKLAADLLRTASDVFANHGCNDWEFPDDWTEQERHDFVKEYHDYNGDPEEFNPKFLRLHDYAVMAFLARKLATP